MNKFKYCPVIEVGDTFTRIDKNGKVWKAEVVRRTECFVDVKKTQPYQIKVLDDNGFTWHYEDAEPTFERCEIHRHYEEIEDGETEADGIWGKYAKKLFKKVPTAFYWIAIKENYSAHSKYDRTYKLKKYGDGVEESKETCKDEFNLFYKYCEEN